MKRETIIQAIVFDSKRNALVEVHHSNSPDPVTGNDLFIQFPSAHFHEGEKCDKTIADAIAKKFGYKFVFKEVVSNNVIVDDKKFKYLHGDIGVHVTDNGSNTIQNDQSIALQVLPLHELKKDTVSIKIDGKIQNIPVRASAQAIANEMLKSGKYKKLVPMTS